MLRLKMGVLMIVFLLLGACTKEDTLAKQNTNTTDPTITESESSLLFMLEEEKLARDTYLYLDSLYSYLKIFKNISSSEQKHMDFVANLLDSRSISYQILDRGQFADTSLQALYNNFKIKGQIGLAEGLHIGATIEDLDIYDLQNFIADSQDADLIDLYNTLICGSGNHMRAFVSNLQQQGLSYQAQFLSQTEVDSILAGSHTHCGP
tara:strand:+ start:22 stop:642 length:621 start_codon:yes stop_codon:yes gene_type:complete